jgi:uncharacterized protein (DUF1778 family)
MNETATYSTPCHAQFRAARVVVCCVSQKTDNDTHNAHADSSPITLSLSASAFHVSSATEGSIFSKSAAQVRTPVSPQGVSPGSDELKLDHGRGAPRNDKRRNPLTVRLSDAERAIIEAKAKAAGCTTNGYVRAAALGSDYKPVRDAELTKALLSLNREFVAQGNNLNQIAKLRNGGKATDAEAESMLGVIARSMLKTHKAVRAVLGQGEEPHP